MIGNKKYRITMSASIYNNKYDRRCQFQLSFEIAYYITENTRNVKNEIDDKSQHSRNTTYFFTKYVEK